MGAGLGWRCGRHWRWGPQLPAQHRTTSGESRGVVTAAWICAPGPGRPSANLPAGYAFLPDPRAIMGQPQARLGTSVSRGQTPARRTRERGQTPAHGTRERGPQKQSHRPRKNRTRGRDSCVPVTLRTQGQTGTPTVGRQRPTVEPLW